MTDPSELPLKPREGFVVSVTEELPAPRKFLPETVAAWIAEDEADMRKFEEGSTADHQ